MPHFTRNTAVAITWAPSGECRGIRMKRTGTSCKVVGHWAGQTDANHAAPEIISDGTKELNAKDAGCLLASGIANGWDATDVRIPHVPAAQLTNALAFELRKHTPLSLDRLVWGYRCLARKTAKEQALYRIVFVKKELWKKWCGIFATMAPLDAIVPVPVVLDPLCDKVTVTFPRADHGADAYLPTPEGRTFKPVSTLDASNQPKPLTELLGTDFIQLGDLESLPLAEQYGYADAMLLAAYGLTSNATQDVETLMPLPASLKPHRSVALVISACIFLAIIIASLFLYLAMTIKSNLTQQQELRKTLTELETGINRQRAIIRPERLKKIQELQAEFAGEIPDYPPLPLVLNALSEIISPYEEQKPWISSRLTWQHDSRKLTFSVEEPLGEKPRKAYIERPELIDELADCPYIVDVRANSSVINRRENKCIREFTITLGWPERAKREAAAKRNVKRAEQRKKDYEAREKKLQEARARAKAEVEQAQRDMLEDEQSESTPSYKHLSPQKGAPPLRGINQQQLPPPPPPPPPTGR